MGRMRGPEGTLSYEDPTAPEGENVKDNMTQVERAGRIKFFLNNQTELTAEHLPEAERLAAALDSMIKSETSKGHIGSETAINVWKDQKIILDGIVENLKPRAAASSRGVGRRFVTSLQELAKRVSK